MELKDFISSSNISLYMKELPTEDTIEKTLFPSKLVAGTKLEYAKGAKNKSVALRQSTFDAAAKVRALRAELNLKSMDFPYFKEALTIDETTRRELLNAIAANNKNLVDALLAQVYENYADLVKGAEIVAKKMRASVLQNGYLNFVGGVDGDIVMDYDVPSEHRETITSSSDKWTVSSADIVGDVNRIKKLMVNGQYKKPRVMYMTENTFDSTFCINDAITAHLRNSNLNTNSILTQQDYLNFTAQFLGLRVIFLEDTTYIPYEGASPVRYYEDNKVVFAPAEALGECNFGMTPEQFDKIHGSGKLDTTVIQDQIAITTMVKADPVTVDTKVSVMPMVSFTEADNVYYLNF